MYFGYFCVLAHLPSNPAQRPIDLIQLEDGIDGWDRPNLQSSEQQRKMVSEDGKQF